MLLTTILARSTQNGIPYVDPGYGPHPVGLVHYHPDNYMSATVASTTPEDRPQNLTWPYRAAQGDANWALVGKHMIAYTGPFHLNESVPVIETDGGVEGQVVHGPLEVASLPSFVGSYQRREFSLLFQGANATFLNLQGDLGQGTRQSLWWEKI